MTTNRSKRYHVVQPVNLCKGEECIVTFGRWERAKADQIRVYSWGTEDAHIGAMYNRVPMFNGSTAFLLERLQE